MSWMMRLRSPITGRKSSRPNADRDDLTVYEIPTAFYLSEGRLYVPWPYCPHRGWTSCEARPAVEPAPDTAQAEYVRRFAEYVGLYADQDSRIEDFFWPLGMTCN
jgi:hypothetical protein